MRQSGGKSILTKVIIGSVAPVVAMLGVLAVTYADTGAGHPPKTREREVHGPQVPETSSWSRSSQDVVRVELLREQGI